MITYKDFDTNHRYYECDTAEECLAFLYLHIFKPMLMRVHYDLMETGAAEWKPTDDSYFSITIKTPKP